MNKPAIPTYIANYPDKKQSNFLKYFFILIVLIIISCIYSEEIMNFLGLTNNKNEY